MYFFFLKRAVKQCNLVLTTSRFSTGAPAGIAWAACNEQFNLSHKRLSCTVRKSSKLIKSNHESSINRLSYRDTAISGEPNSTPVCMAYSVMIENVTFTVVSHVYVCHDVCRLIWAVFYCTWAGAWWMSNSMNICDCKEDLGEKILQGQWNAGQCKIDNSDGFLFVDIFTVKCSQ